VAAGRRREALAALAPIVEDPELPDAALLAGELVAHGTATAGLPEHTRIAMLVAASDRFASQGLRTRARESIAAARTIHDDPTLAALEASWAPSGAIDTPEAWLRRVLAFCAADDPDRAPLRFHLRGHVTAHGGTFFTTVAMPPTGPEVLRCAARLAPETPLDVPFRADVVVNP
jgi:hypothetical protein